MTKKTINYNTILKRSRCTNTSLTESTKVDSQKIFNNLVESVNKYKNGRNATTQQLLRSYIESMCNSDNASKYYYQFFNLLEKFNDIDPVVSSRILTEFTNRVLPYVDNTEAVYETCMKYNLYNDQKDTLYTECNLYTVADRIVNNHKTVSKRFNIEREANRVNTIGLKYFIDSCADMIDTYNIKEYQKMNLVIEEGFYALNKNAIQYDNKDFIKYVVEYYLSKNPYISVNEICNLKRAITENYVIGESDCEDISYFMNSEYNDNQPAPKSIQDGIQQFLLSGNKSGDTLGNCISDIMMNTNKDDIIYNFSNLVYLLWDLIKNKTFESDDSIYSAFKIMIDNISGYTKLINYNSDNGEFSKEDIIKIINTLSSIKSEIELIGNSSPIYSSAAVNFIKLGINPALESLNYVKNILYNKSNIDAMKFVNSENTNIISLKEFKIFKFHNLVNAAYHLNKFLKVKERRMLNNLNNKKNKFIRKAKNILFGESAKDFNGNIYQYIGEDCKADICVRQYLYEESEVEELSSYLESICCEYNDLLLSQNNDTTKCYYILNPGIAEIRIKESSSIELSENDIELVKENIDDSIDLYLEEFYSNYNKIMEFNNFMETPINEQILDFSKYKNFTMEHFDLMIEALSYLDIDPSIIKELGERFTDYQFNKAVNEGMINESYISLSRQEIKVNESVDNWKPISDTPDFIKLEAYEYLLDIITEASQDIDDEDEAEYQRYMEARKKAAEEKKKQKQLEKNKGSVSNNSQTQKKPSEIVNSNDKKDDEIDPSSYGKYKKHKGIININSIKLGLMGLRKKFKDLDNKQKDMSRNLDNAVRSTVGGIKNAIVSDRREAIIKGQVIPSFSRLLKAGLGLVLLGVASGNVAIPVITAVGGLALSKKLNDNERTLLLDEIETELEVVDKELTIADNNNQLNKYRALLQYKKELQRQYQRIRYNLRVGKDIMPSNVGMTKSLSGNN